MTHRLASAAALLAAVCGAAAEPIRPGHPEWPVAWSSYRKVVSPEADAADLKAHKVGLIASHVRTVADAKAALDLARRTGLKFHIDLPEITENIGLIKKAGLTPVEAVLIGGVYQGKAVDRHLFRFTAGKHEIVIEPPVYSKGLPYTRGSGGTGAPKDSERVGHYFPGIKAPLRAEVVVPLKPFDGRQHLRILPAAVTELPGDTPLEADSADAPALASAPEIKNRTLYRLSFDLSGLDDALLDQVGLAVYWTHGDQNIYWMFGHGSVSANAETTREALRQEIRQRLAVWSEANGGAFPLDVVLAARYGDECFYITSHLNAPAVNLPLRDYSEPSLRAFAARAGDTTTYPRTWGFPEIYGPDAYAWWLYTLHESCARLAGTARDELARTAPGLLLFRNTTRGGVFSLANDHDGSGQELLARQLDIVHLDPYPVSAGGYGRNIPTDMSYCAGLARRHSRLLIPWMQAHTYGGPGGLTDVSPAQVDRMAEEVWAHGVDAIMWLGYGDTFPNVRPDSWEQAARFHMRLAQSPPPKPKAELAVLRPYRVWALSSLCGDAIRNPADWMLQQFLHVWAVDHGQPYDVFEVPPAQTAAERDRLEKELAAYPHLVSTEPRAGAWVIGSGTAGQAVSPREASEHRQTFDAQLRDRGWLRPAAPRVPTSSREVPAKR
jgi:hypothetical protein